MGCVCLWVGCVCCVCCCVCVWCVCHPARLLLSLRECVASLVLKMLFRARLLFDPPSPSRSTSISSKTGFVTPSLSTPGMGRFFFALHFHRLPFLLQTDPYPITPSPFPDTLQGPSIIWRMALPFSTDVGSLSYLLRRTRCRKLSLVHSRWTVHVKLALTLGLYSEPTSCSINEASLATPFSRDLSHHCGVTSSLVFERDTVIDMAPIL